MPLSCINQSTDLDCQSIDWSNYEGDIGLKWAKIKLQYVTYFNLIRKTSGIISFEGMRDTNYETMSYGWK